MSTLRSSHSRSRPSSSTGRPTTPLRRVSSSSLRQLSLSHSLNNSISSHSHPTASGDPLALAHLAPVVAELADAVSDLTANFEHLERVHGNLQGINEAFAAYLYGLRANTYTADFSEAPTKLNFDLASTRASESHAAALLSQQREQQQQQQQQQQQASPPGSPSSHHPQHGGETTFMTNDDSFASPPRASSAARGGRGGAGAGRGRGGIPAARGRGGAAVGRGGKVAGPGGVVSKRRKEEMAAFADPLLPLLPITLRENRRQECEKVLWALKERSEAGGGEGGAKMADLVAALSSPTHPVTQVRINEVLLALVRAKVVVKGLVKGVAQYRLDLSRCS